MNVRIKICGICSLEDALACSAAGADALGFLCGVPLSVRSYIDPGAAGEIIRQLPPYLSSVLVTTLSDAAQIQKILDETHVSALQLQGPIQPAGVQSLRNSNPHLKIIKAIQVVDQNALQEAQNWESFADALLLDTKGEGPLGGTGKTHDWKLSRKIAETLPIPVILAGGLSPDNVAQAIETVRPFAVDVNSGVTGQPPAKNLVKVAEFVKRARQAGV
ncbi:MAG TPA: phosphoribosylanthranilate isomerase [Acidobacteriota bacterium]|jgi:phosphoribosylanthranilate isomerase